MSGVLTILAGGDARATRMADAIVLLVREGAELGELDRATVRDEAGAREMKLFPPRWFDRLALAAERGAFERMSVAAIVGRILGTHDAGAAA